MDLNEILTKERDSLRDENIELQKRINELEVSLQKALNLLENDNWNNTIQFMPKISWKWYSWIKV